MKRLIFVSRDDECQRQTSVQIKSHISPRKSTNKTKLVEKKDRTFILI
jgi:hypothetical protein